MYLLTLTILSLICLKTNFHLDIEFLWVIQIIIKALKNESWILWLIKLELYECDFLSSILSFIGAGTQIRGAQGPRDWDVDVVLDSAVPGITQATQRCSWAYRAAPSSAREAVMIGTNLNPCTTSLVSIFGSCWVSYFLSSQHPPYLLPMHSLRARGN